MQRKSSAAKRTRKRDTSGQDVNDDSPTRAPESGEPMELGRCRGEEGRSGEPDRDQNSGREPAAGAGEGRRSRPKR